jgi:hypothetical protein
LQSDAVIIVTNIIVLPVAAYITLVASRSHHELVTTNEPVSDVSR